jgi:uridine kinase
MVISEDSYYKDLSEISVENRKEINYDHPDALDHALLQQHLTQLQQGKSADIPIYDYAKHQRSSETKKVGPHQIIVLEGILLFVEKNLRDMMDIRIFMDTPLDICLVRRLQRDIIERQRDIHCILAQYQKTVRPMYLQFIEPSKRYADIIVPRGGENRIAIDMIQAKMRELLNIQK